MQGEVRILGVTAPERVPAYDARPPSWNRASTPFVNWRGFFAAPGTSDEKVAEYVSALEAMYETDAWEAVRSRNGWVNIWNPGDDFRTFLEAQETGDRRPDAELGFL
jgi:putative tricarboxylic transport membrane protein